MRLLATLLIALSLWLLSMLGAAAFPPQPEAHAVAVSDQSDLAAEHQQSEITS